MSPEPEPVRHRSIWLVAPPLPGSAGDVGLVPLQHHRDELSRLQHRDVHRERGLGRRARGVEVQQRLARRAGRGGREGGRGVVVGIGAAVAGGGEVGHARGLDGVDGLRHEAVLEERLIEVGHVVGDDVGAGAGERLDAAGKVRLAHDRRVEGELRAGGDVVHDLHHGATFVAIGQQQRRAVVRARGLLRGMLMLAVAGRSPLATSSVAVAVKPLEA